MAAVSFAVSPTTDAATTAVLWVGGGGTSRVAITRCILRLRTGRGARIRSAGTAAALAVGWQRLWPAVYLAGVVLNRVGSDQHAPAPQPKRSERHRSTRQPGVAET